MKVELKTVNLTKSKIEQMGYCGIPGASFDVLGWVRIGEKRCVLVKMNGCYYRADFVTKVVKEEKAIQFPLPNNGWEWPMMTTVKVETDRGSYGFVTDRDDAKNIELYNHLVSYKRKTERSEQIYY